LAYRKSPTHMYSTTVHVLSFAVNGSNYVIRLQKRNLFIGGLLCCKVVALSMSQVYNGLRIPSTLRIGNSMKTNIAANGAH